MKAFFESDAWWTQGKENATALFLGFEAGHQLISLICLFNLICDKSLPFGTTRFCHVTTLQPHNVK